MLLPNDGGPLPHSITPSVRWTSFGILVPVMLFEWRLKPFIA